MSALPACGLYRTTRSLGEHVGAGRLVYFHNHGEPGPGVYLPKGWSFNRASWHQRGHVIPDEGWARTLVSLPAEGLYRVQEGFTCCERNCRTFEPNLLVQLGYNERAEAILFVPELTPSGLAFPEQGSALAPEQLSKLAALKVVASALPQAGPVH